MKFFVKISSILPNRIIRAYEQMLIYAGMGDVSPRAFAGYSIVLAFFISLFVSFSSKLLFSIDNTLTIIFAVSLFFMMFALSYVYLSVVADNRAKAIEKVLPDALQLVAANIQAGMTIDNALWLCAKPEFGEFEDEVQKMAAQTLAGKTLIDALKDLSKRVKSVVLHRAVMLLIQGIQLGGELAHLLIQIAADIRTTQALQNEIRAATAMYSLFILFASVFAAPALFAVSTFYVETTNVLWSGKIGQVSPTGGAGLNVISIKGSMISTEDVKLFAIVAIIITTVFASLIMGLITSGQMKRGLKYTPFFVLGGLGIHFVTYSIIKSMFGALI
ncbi:hypothetical protein DRN74_01345 [Candidatus Micrarchaeota archaeon]|nr:MAG: hypothetical protein DRN74_01345 [Candidatus Micrarchaeota archaeon]